MNDVVRRARALLAKYDDGRISAMLADNERRQLDADPAEVAARFQSQPRVIFKRNDDALIAPVTQPQAIDVQGMLEKTAGVLGEEIGLIEKHIVQRQMAEVESLRAEMRASVAELSGRIDDLQAEITALADDVDIERSAIAKIRTRGRHDA